MNNKSMYDISMAEVVSLISAVGHKRTVIVEGAMGSGKTTGIGRGVANNHPDHIYIEFDCTNKDIQDLSTPKFMKAVEDMVSDYVEFVPNSELGVHLGKPVIINFDEFMKAPPPVKKGVRRIMLERKVGNIDVTPDSIMYGTSNLAAEGLGDNLPAHQRNAVITVRMRKSTADEWVDWAIDNDLHPSVIGYAKENPHIFQSFEDISDPSENEYIHDPRVQRDGVITGRSLHAASDVLHQRDHLTDATVTAALIGAIGRRGALDMMAFVELADQLPSLQSIKDDPLNAKVPNNSSATAMVVYRAISLMERDWLDAWMQYMERLPKEDQAVFVMAVTKPTYKGQTWIMLHGKFATWCRENGYLIAKQDKE